MDRPVITSSTGLNTGPNRCDASPTASRSEAVGLDPTVEKAILRFIPDLRDFAFSLCRNRERADDLVQETLTRAIAGIGTFKKGTNLEAWLFTILRNNFRNEYRRSRRTEQDIDGRRAELLTVLPDQDGWSIAEDLRSGLGSLPLKYRQALILVGACGLAYDEAAAVAGCETGTIKSRVNRARTMLAAFMSDDSRVLENVVSDRVPPAGHRFVQPLSVAGGEQLAGYARAVSPFP